MAVTELSRFYGVRATPAVRVTRMGFWAARKGFSKEMPMALLQMAVLRPAHRNVTMRMDLMP